MVVVVVVAVVRWGSGWVIRWRWKYVEVEVEVVLLVRLVRLVLVLLLMLVLVQFLADGCGVALEEGCLIYFSMRAFFFWLQDIDVRWQRGGAVVRLRAHARRAFSSDVRHALHAALLTSPVTQNKPNEISV